MINHGLKILLPTLWIRINEREGVQFFQQSGRVEKNRVTGAENFSKDRWCIYFEK